MKTLGNYTLNAIRKLCLSHADCTGCPLCRTRTDVTGKMYLVCNLELVGWCALPRRWDEEALSLEVPKR